ncbi:MAG: neutral zinc metallopeptidase [Noviherbaspirillum sp.]
MRWEGNRRSDNVEDRRGSFMPGRRSVGIGTIAIALVASYFLGVDPGTVIGILTGGQPAMVEQGQGQRPPADDRTTRFVSTVLADTEDVWTAIFQANGNDYPEPRLVLFAGQTPTACGTGQSAAGPFYCPADQQVYIDLSFFRLMRERFNVSSEFAQAYVIAHEVGHHVQNVTGIMRKVDSVRRRASEAEANALSVRLELQADCFAGVWASHANQARSILEQGDVEAALRAASAIGDDTLQKQAQGYAVPDSFTHGTSAQRVRWFSRGIRSGKISDCDTFSGQPL